MGVADLEHTRVAATPHLAFRKIEIYFYVFVFYGGGNKEDLVCFQLLYHREFVWRYFYRILWSVVDKSLEFYMKGF